MRNSENSLCRKLRYFTLKIQNRSWCHTVCFPSAKKLNSVTARFQSFVAAHHKSLQQVQLCSLLSKISLGPSSKSNPVCWIPKTSCPALRGQRQPRHRNPLTSRKVWIVCVRCWSHHTGYHKWNPTLVQCGEKSLWLCPRTEDSGLWRLWRPAMQQCAALCFWRLCSSDCQWLTLKTTLHYYTIATTVYVQLAALLNCITWNLINYNEWLPEPKL